MLPKRLELSTSVNVRSISKDLTINTAGKNFKSRIPFYPVYKQQHDSGRNVV